MGRYRKRKNKPLYKHSAKKLAVKNARALAKMEADEETKWIDEHSLATSCRNFPETTNADVLCLNSIRPRSVLPTATSEIAINTSNTREGAEVYISGIYLNVQFYWDMTTTDNLFYPPFATINYAIVRELKNQSALAANIPGSYQRPGPLDVFTNPLQGQNTGAGATPFSVPEGPLSNLVFRNMNNGHNYKILRKGQFILPGPTQVNSYPPTRRSADTPPQPNDQWIQGFPSTAYKSVHDGAVTPSTRTDWSYTPHQFSGNTCRTLRFHLHPKTKCRYSQTDNSRPTSDEEVEPMMNGVYFMYWTDSASGPSSRWPTIPQGADANVEYVRGPTMLANWRTRFKDV